MRSPLFLSLALTFLSSLALAVSPEQRQIDIFVWPLSAPKASTLAQISFSPTNASIASYTAPKFPQKEEIVRVGFYQPSGQWSGIATVASNLQADKSKVLQLHVRPDGELYHVGLKLSEPVSQEKGRSQKDGLSVEVMQIKKGPVPALNKPVVVSADGEEAKEPEKSFLQKYCGGHAFGSVCG